MSMGARPADRPRAVNGLVGEVDREEHDAFGEGGAQDRLHQDRGGRAGIPADRFRGFHADETHAEGGAEGGEDKPAEE